MRELTGVITVEGIISQEEKNTYFSRLSCALRKKRAYESEKKTYNARVKSDIASVQEEIDELTTIVETNRAVHDVECTIEYDFDGNKKKWLHKDTGEVVRTTEIPDDEKNEELSFAPENETPEDGEEGLESNE